VVVIPVQYGKGSDKVAGARCKEIITCGEGLQGSKLVELIGVF
jgi:hypothetical protein